MATISKPKRSTDPYMVDVMIRQRDRGLILECLDSDAERAGGLITGVEKLLSMHFNKMRRALDAPLPAHIVAALGPIESRSKELADRLNPQELPVAVLRELNIPEVWDGQAWQLLTSIHVHASIALDRMKNQRSSGMHVRRYGEQLELARNDLEHQFNACRALRPDDDPEEYEGAKQEFLKICRKYLPKAPTA